MRFAWLARSILALGAVALAAASAEAQINPAAQIRWPSCPTGASIYSIPSHTCIAPGTANNPALPANAFQCNIGGVFGPCGTIMYDGINGLVVPGNVAGATATFTGNLAGATATFTGNLAGATGTFTGNLAGATGTFTGNLAAGTAITDSTGAPAVGRNVTPWDQGFESTPQNLTPWGWHYVGASVISQTSSGIAYQGNYAMQVTGSATGGSGTFYELGPQASPLVPGQGQEYPVLNAIAGRTYTLHGYYKTSGGSQTFSVQLAFNCTSFYAGDGTLQTITLPTTSTWTQFTVLIVAPALTVGRANYVLLGQNETNASETMYFDEVTLVDGLTASTPTRAFSGLDFRNLSTTGTLAFAGESLTVGYGGSHPWTNDVVTPGYPSPALTVINDGMGGDTSARTVGSASTLIDPQFSPAAPANVVVLWTGVNDLLNLSGAWGITYNNMQQFCRERHRLGWKCFICTLESLTGQDTNRDALNAGLRTTWSTFADGLIDLGANSTIGADGASANTTYFLADGIHMTDAGYAIVSGLVNTSLTNYFSATYEPSTAYSYCAGTNSLTGGGAGNTQDRNVCLKYDATNGRGVLQSTDFSTGTYTPLALNPSGGKVILPPAGVSGPVITDNLLIEKTVSFTPTTTGWYRVIDQSTTGTTFVGGTLRIYAPYTAGAVTDDELQFHEGGYGGGGSIQLTRYAPYGTGMVTQARISNNGGSQSFLDLYVSTVGGPIALYFYGPYINSVVASPVVGATAGADNVSTLAFGLGFGTTAPVRASAFTIGSNSAPVQSTGTQVVGQVACIKSLGPPVQIGTCSGTVSATTGTCGTCN
jgi:lysophospholipase L1-like esterase